MIFFKKHQAKSLTKKLKVMKQARIHNPVSDELIAKERALYLRLAVIYESLVGHKQFPFADILRWECVRAAAAIDDPMAQYQLAHHLIEQAKCREEVEKQALLANASNARQARELFDEGLAYLQAAENLNHIMAKRYHGLCYIFGWGLVVDKDQGFDLVVESIDKANAWEKVPQIFAEIGLNTPEFFSALAKRRRM